jgi:hypothetical protein
LHGKTQPLGIAARVQLSIDVMDRKPPVEAEKKASSDNNNNMTRSFMLTFRYSA